MAKRTKYAGEVTVSDVDQTITLKGWVQKRRNLGALIFVDLRDRSGIVQIVFKDDASKNLHDLAETLRNEYVIEVTGKVCKRANGEANERMKTGEIEIEVTDLKVLSTSKALPFNIEDHVDVKEDLKLKYRYLDLRRPEMQRAIMLRSKIKHVIHRFMDENGFIDIETPDLTKSTPEGARDFLVPSRTYNGNFWALPQSPQLFKQLLMSAGFDRYYQIARCFRDEDLRGDRQPEFTQVDIETSFLSEEEIMTIAEQLISTVLKEVINVDVKLPIERMGWNEAMDNYGSDKPDLRFDMKLINVEEVVSKTDFKVFSSALNNGGIVRALVAPKAGDKFSRKDIDSWGEYVKRFGAKGLAWLKVKDGELAGPVAKFMKPVTEELLKATEAEDDDLILFAADEKEVVYATLGYLRTFLGEKLGLIDHDQFRFVWITDWPMFHYSKEEDRYMAEHHPFTLPKEDTLEYLESDPSKVYAYAYDICLNGYELGGGSLRIHTREMQEKMFKALGFTAEDANERFGFLMNALDYGFPPHGGLAFGLDRFAMLLAKKNNIRDVIAFPKNSKGVEVLTDAPGEVEQAQLDELGLKVLKKMPSADLQKIENISVTDEVSLRRYQLNDAKEIQQLVEENRDNLAKFLPWATANDLAAEESFVKEAVASFDAGVSFDYVIEKNEKIVGTIDLHNIHKTNAEIGYWLAENHQHQGIMTMAVKKLVEALSPVLNLHRVVIKTDPSNVSSQKVALNAGFTLEGVQHGAVEQNGEFKDFQVYYYLIEGE